MAAIRRTTVQRITPRFIVLRTMPRARSTTVAGMVIVHIATNQSICTDTVTITMFTLVQVQATTTVHAIRALASRLVTSF